MFGSEFERPSCAADGVEADVPTAGVPAPVEPPLLISAPCPPDAPALPDAGAANVPPAPGAPAAPPEPPVPPAAAGNVP